MELVLVALLVSIFEVGCHIAHLVLAKLGDEEEVLLSLLLAGGWQLVDDCQQMAVEAIVAHGRGGGIEVSLG